jgi:hypothetical protein
MCAPFLFDRPPTPPYKRAGVPHERPKPDGRVVWGQAALSAAEPGERRRGDQDASIENN